MEIKRLKMIGDNKLILSSQSFIQLEPSAVISCNSGDSGFVFGVMHSLQIANLSFMHCSADVISAVVHLFPDIPPEYYIQNITAALGFFLVEDLHLSGVLVQNNTGFGLAALNLLGNSSIVNSIFVFNRGDEYHPGGNTLVYFMLIELMCTLFPHKAMNLNITSSKFMHGSTMAFAGLRPFPPGLGIVIYQECSHVTICINNSVFSDNYNKKDLSFFGANLAIVTANPKYNTAFHTIVIDNCCIERGRADFGGGMALYALESMKYMPPHTSCTVKNADQESSVQIINTEIVQNTATYAAGGLVVALNLCYKYTVEIRNTTFSGNSLVPVGESPNLGLWPKYLRSLSGGNLGISILPATPYQSVRIEDCIFRSGVAQYGGAIGTMVAFFLLSNERHPNNSKIVSITNTKFENNSADFGGAVWMYLLAEKLPKLQKYHTPTVSVVRIGSCTFANNTAYLGAALAFTSERNYNTFTDLQTSTFFQLTIQNTSFENNQSPSESIVLSVLNYKLTPTTVTRSTVYLYGIQNISFANCIFKKNNISGLLAEKSNVFLEGDNIFYNNSGVRGGAIFLLYSYLYPRLNTKISFVNNRASEVGGAIYIREELSPYGNYPCPIRPDTPNDMPYNKTGIVFEFNNNTARDAGASIYGGYFDTCNAGSYKVLRLSASSSSSNANTKLNAILNFTNNRSEVSEISSDPIGVCFCDGCLQNCTQKLRSITTFPGAQFNVTALTVGQQNGYVKGVVRATFRNSSLHHSLGKLQDSQTIDRYCTNLTYRVRSNNSVEYLELTVVNPSELFGYLFNPPTISIQLLPCPLGFALQGFPPACGCSSILKHAGIKCNITTQTIHRPAGFWVGYSNANTFPSQNTSRKITVHKHCPFDYCIPKDNDINLEHPDEQCDFNRSGVLCGQCRQGFSTVLGSNRCRKCENKYLSLLLAFGVAGLVLVAFLIMCNLTIAEGTLSGLVLYANIVQANRSSFLPCEANNTDDIVLKAVVCKLSYITSWLSLDLGIETCFYDGMDMYSKAWLQFVFPVYIWFIVIVIITASHYSPRAARLFGRNAPKVLATLFLLSYTKILDAVFTAFSFTFLDNGRQVVWLYDGNVEYFRGKHIPLVILATLFMLAFLVPYTLIVLCIQCLQRRSWYGLLGWVRRLKPLLDAYTGPYKDKYRFWTGLLLLVRFILLLAYACNAQGGASLNVLLTGVAASCLLAVEWAFMGIFRKWPLDLLEGSFLLNIAILSAATLYTKTVNGDQTIVAFISIIITCAMLMGILIFHVNNRFRNLRCIKKQLLLQSVPIPPENETPPDDDDDPPLRLTYDESQRPILEPKKQ